MIKIGVDIMGGDFAPKEIVLGAIQACKELPENCKIVLIGDEEAAKKILINQGFDQTHFEFVHTTEIIEMGEHPAKAYSKKSHSSIAVGFNLLKKGQIDSFASAGNTGAMLVGAMYSVKSISGVMRPCIAAPIPRPDGKFTLLLDVGLNADCKPDILFQYGILGSIYAKHVFGVNNPKVGLLNIGSEEEKGNLVTQSAHQMMKNSHDFNFIGNVEGTDLFDFDKADVLVCDGFVGNIVLKLTEAFYMMLKNRNISDEYIDRFNFEYFGGTPILGITGNVIIGHGVSKAIAIKNMLILSKDVIEADLPEKFKEKFN